MTPPPSAVRTPAARIVRATTAVSLVAVAVKACGFAEKLVLAYFFGTGSDIDAYFVALSVPFMLFVFTREVIEPAFLPTFLDLRRHESEATAWRLWNVVASVAAIILCATCVLVVVGSRGVVSVLAPGFDGVTRETAVMLTRVVTPAAAFLGLSALTYITLNSYKRFVIPALSDLAYKVAPITVLALFARRAGVFAAAVGALVGAAARLSVHVVALWRHRGLWAWSLDVRDPAVRRVRTLMIPLLLGIVFSQLGSIVDNVFASRMESGSISALAFARKLVEMPVLVFPYSLGVVLFPFFAEFAVSRDTERLSAVAMSSLRVVMLVFVPLAVGFVVLDTAIVRVVFERGAFGAESTALTSSALHYYAFGVVSFALEAVIVQLYFSMSDTRTPIAVGVACVILNVMITFVLIRFMHHDGIALALTISKTVKVVVLYALLGRRLPSFRLAAPLGFATKVVGAALVMGVVAERSAALLGLQSAARPPATLLRLMGVALIGGVVYSAALLATRDRWVLDGARWLREKRWLVR